MEGLHHVCAVDFLNTNSEEIGPLRITREPGQPVAREYERLEEWTVDRKRSEACDGLLGSRVQSDGYRGCLLYTGQADREGIAWNVRWGERVC